MPTPPIPADEKQRLESLHTIEDFGINSDGGMERVTRLAARLLGAPIAFLSLVGRERVKITTRVGLTVDEMPRDDSFCAWAILNDEPLVVPDASSDPRFAASPLVVGATSVRFYAGCPVSGPDGRRLGALAVLDRVPRDMESSDLVTLADLARCAGDLLCTGHAGRLFVGLAHDMRERERREQELRRQATALEAAANAIVITGRDGVIRWVNPAFTRLTGYSREEVVGQDTRILSSGKHDAAFYEALWQTILSGRVWHGDVMNRRKSGDLYMEEMTITPVLDGHGEITEFVAIKQDITERKAVERMKNEFVSTVSHELRTPLTSIRGSLGLIAGGLAGELSPQAKRLIEIAMNNSDRLVRLINDVLDIEKIESGRMDFRMQPVDLVGLVQQAIDANQAFAAQHGVVLELREAPERVEVLGDSDRLVQVVTNLLSNAAKFSPSGGRVAIQLAPAADSIRVSVADQGPGIPDEFRGRIFRKFAQADSSDARSKGGTGLGLSIVKAIVERHGGRIGFDTAAGGGTTFWFEIPERRQEPVPERSAPPRVLICEDHTDTATLLEMVLEQAGFETMVAPDAAQAKALLAQHVFRAMTVDVLLPDQDGISLIRELRTDARTRDLPVVVVSGKSDADRDALAGDSVGISDWIEKPITAERITAAVRSAVLPRVSGRPKVLHVEDNGDIRALVSMLLKDSMEVRNAHTMRVAKEMIANEEFGLVILDPMLPDGNGLDLLPLMRDLGKGHVPVVVFSAGELSQDGARTVAAALVKSRTSNEELLRTITGLVS